MRTEALRATDSTSLEAVRRAAKGDHGPLWLWADEQTAGRGRSGREWDSPRGNLYATFLMPVVDDPVKAALHSFVACLAVADTLNVLVGSAAQVWLKWPNDALLDGHKAAGILLESGMGEAGRWLSIGIGINLAHSPVDTRWPATSVTEVTGQEALEAETTLYILSAAMAVRLRQFEEKGFASIRGDWLARAARLGELVEARLPSETVTGVFETLDETGAMLLQTGTGLRLIHAADVFFPGGGDAAGH